MGYRQAAVLTPVCFFLGVLFVCFNVDYRVLRSAQDQQAITDDFQFYTTFYSALPAVKALLHGMIGVGVIGLVAKVAVWDESALFFDGSSLAAYIFSIAMHFSVTLPALKTIVDPVPDVDTEKDQIEAMQLLAAGNTIVIVLMGAILVLQAGQEYARRMEANELAKFVEQERVAASIKKDE